MRLAGIFAVSCVFVIQSTFAGEVWVIKSPQGFEFDASIPMKQNDVSSVLFRLFGISETSDCSWPGLKQTNPFSSAKKTIVVAIPYSRADKDSYEFPGKKIPLASNFNPDGLVFALDHPISVVFGPKAGVEVVDPATIPVTKKFQLPANTLNASTLPVSHFVDELSALKELPSVLSQDITPAKALIFEFDSLDALGNRENVAEARRLVGSVLADLAGDTDAAILAVCYTSEQKSRTRRQADAEQAENDYVVPFNLVLWLSLALFFITLAVCIGIGSMDPGWDSIIYRMTNQRIKKDN